MTTNTGDNQAIRDAGFVRLDLGGSGKERPRNILAKFGLIVGSLAAGAVVIHQLVELPNVAWPSLEQPTVPISTSYWQSDSYVATHFGG